MNWELFIGMFYGLILGIVGNMFVELFIQRFYPKGVPRRVAEIGMYLMGLVMVLGLLAVLTVSQYF